MSARSFLEAVLAGEAHLTEIDTWVERWHSGSPGTLAECLGMTEQQYARWVREPATLDSILEEKRRAAHAS